MASVWYGAALQRSKKMPDFGRFVPAGPGDKTARTRPTPERATAMARQLIAITQKAQLLGDQDGHGQQG